MFQFKSLSAVDRVSATAFMKMTLAFALCSEYEFDAPFLRKLTKWHSESQDFIKRFKLDKKAFDKVYKAILSNQDPDDDEEMLESMMTAFKSLREVKAALNKETDLSDHDNKMIDSIRLLATKQSASALRFIQNNVTYLTEPDYTDLFTTDAESIDTSDAQAELRTMVKQIGKVNGLIMPTAVLEKWQAHNKLKGKKLAAHARYLELTKELRESYKKFVQTIIRQGGKPLMPIDAVVRACEASKVPHNLPLSFVGSLDEKGRFYTSAGKRLIQTLSGDVRMNPKYDASIDNAYVCSFKPLFAQDFARAFTEDYRSKSKTAKFSAVLDAIPTLPKATRKWRSDLKRSSTREGMIATLAELIHMTSFRVSSTNAKTSGSQTFGATTLKTSHIKDKGKGIVITFKGKSGALQKREIADRDVFSRQLIANIRQYVKTAPKSGYIFEDEDGKLITGTIITRYLRKCGMPASFTVHMFRTIKATSMASSFLATSPYNKKNIKDEREVHRWLESGILAIGAELGHVSGDKVTANTAIQNYVDPVVLQEFYNNLGIRPSAKVQKAIDAAAKDTKSK